MKHNINHNTYILAVCNGLAISANVVIGTISALATYAIITNKIFATMPIALGYFGSMLMTAPASFLMKHIGRKTGFLIGVSLGMLGTAVCLIGLLKSSFILFCAGSFLIGASNAFSFYYRFAVADVVEASYRSRAISYVMAGGVIAAFIGTNLANITHELISTRLYSGSLLGVLGLFLVNFILLMFINIPKPDDLEAHYSGRPMITIVRQPRFIVAVLAGAISYGLMAFLMAATPLSMQQNTHQFTNISFVIQWHVLGMFAPSFFTGYLISRFGLLNIMLWGALLNAACVVVNLIGTSIFHYWLALFLLGVGWNFLFVSATTLLTETYDVAEKAKTQAFNDFSVFSVVTFAVLSSGILHHNFGWRVINIGCIPWIIGVTISILWLKSKRKCRG